MVQPGGQCREALLRTGIGLRIGPFAQACLNEPFGLAIGTRPVGI